MGTDAGTLLSGVLDILGTGVPRPDFVDDTAGGEKNQSTELVGADTEAGVIDGIVRASDGMLLPGMMTATKGFVALSTEILGLILGNTTSTGLTGVTLGGERLGTLGLRDGVTETGGLGLIELTDGGRGIELGVGVDGETTRTGGKLGVPEDTELGGLTTELGELGLGIGTEVEGVTTGADGLGLEIDTVTELFDGVITTTTVGIVDELPELDTLGEETDIDEGVTLTDREGEKLLLERLDVLDRRFDVLDDDVTVGLRTVEEELDELSSDELELDELERNTLLLLDLELLVEVTGTELELFDVIVTPQMANDEYVVVQLITGSGAPVVVANPPISAIAAPTLTGG